MYRNLFVAWYCLGVFPVTHWSAGRLAQAAVQRGIVDTISERTVNRILKIWVFNSLHQHSDNPDFQARGANWRKMSRGLFFYRNVLQTSRLQSKSPMSPVKIGGVNWIPRSEESLTSVHPKSLPNSKTSRLGDSRFNGIIYYGNDGNAIAHARETMLRYGINV